MSSKTESQENLKKYMEEKSISISCLTPCSVGLKVGFMGGKNIPRDIVRVLSMFIHAFETLETLN